MDLYERLSRMLLRRKYARMEDRSRGDPSPAPHPKPNLAKSKSVKAPCSRAETPRRLERSSTGRSATPAAAAASGASTKRFTLRSSNNEAVDGVWFNNALRRSVAEGRLNLGTLTTVH